MGNVNALISKRLKSNDRSSKMAEMAKQSATGNLTSFSGVFQVTELNEKEKDLLQAILHEYSTGKAPISVDLRSLISITSEVKAINNQAALLHGERIKKAQEILKKYKEGAFTAWLVATYGNRQTPYNFLQYYEFYIAIPKTLQRQIEAMPRQAVYSLASRGGSFEQKRKIVEEYRGESKNEILNLIRETFPISEEDGRKENIGENTATTLARLLAKVTKSQATMTHVKKMEILSLLDQLLDAVKECKIK